MRMKLGRVQAALTIAAEPRRSRCGQSPVGPKGSPVQRGAAAWQEVDQGNSKTCPFKHTQILGDIILNTQFWLQERTIGCRNEELKSEY